MPLHDWTRIDPNDYHTFHYGWIAVLYQRLNAGILPTGYYAMADHTTPPIVPDVVTLATADWPIPDDRSDARGGTAVETPPRATIAVTEAGKRKKSSARWRVAIRHVRHRRIVAVIEIVSPSNKAKKKEVADFVSKSVQLLRQGIHLLLLDPFPPTPRDPSGFHAAVWKNLTGKQFILPPQRPITFASYVARGNESYSAFVEPLTVGELLPDMPLFLTEDRHVVVPLEATYQTTWLGFPQPLRTLLESPVG